MDISFDKKSSQSLKFLLIIMMFWSHMFNHADRMWKNVSWTSIGSVNNQSIEVFLVPFFHVAVPLFFLIGGYAFYINFSRCSGFNERKEALFKQIKKLYGRYLLVFIIFIPLCIIAGKIVFVPFEFVLNIIGISSSYCGEWWFFSTYLEILVFMFFFHEAIIRNNLLNNTKTILFISLLMSVIGYGINYILGKRGIDTSLLIIHEIYYFFIKQPFFVLGYIMAKDRWIERFWSHYKRSGNRHLFNLFFILLIIYILVSPYILLSRVPETFFYLIYLPIFLLVYCYLYEINSTIKKMWVLGKYSTYMWLCHSVLLYHLIQNVIFIPKLSVLCWLLLIIITMAVSKALLNIEKLSIKLHNINRIFK